MIVNFPKRLERQSILQLLSDLDSSCRLDHVILDFSQVGFSVPVAMLVAGSKIRDWWRYRDECGHISEYRGINQDIAAHSYMMHLGFFDFIHVPIGKQIGHARGSNRYLPITRVCRPTVDVYKDGLGQWYADIEATSRKLGAVLSGSHDDTEELRTYTYCIREVIRNVFEHSGADECFICGQRWLNGSVEIALIDEGIGINSTLSENFQIKDDEAALKYCIRPGISRISSDHNAVNVYDNSGFGLFILTQLAASFGWFVLGSGNSQLIGQKDAREIEQTSFSGTYFGMRLIHAPKDFGALISEIIVEGENEAKVSGINARASGRTRLIALLGSQ
jgi:hypothetical protein